MKFILGLIVLFIMSFAYGQLTNRLDKLDVNDLNAKKLTVTSIVSGSIPCPKMTEAQRDALVGPIEGQCVYNSTTKTINVYDGLAWVEVAGGGEGGIAKWEASKAYEIDDVVIEGDNIYICITAHTSGVSFDVSKFSLLAQDLADATGVLSMTKGGTDKALTPELGGVVYTDAGSMEVLGAGTSGKFLKSNGAAAPSWEDVPATTVDDTTFSGVLSLGKGGTSKSLTANNGAVAYSDADSIELLAPGTTGQVLQSNGIAAPSFVNKSVSAKSENASSVTLEEIQVSNNQLTQTATNKHLVESGNKNILVNPSFEHSTFSTGWINSAGTFTEETSLEVHGLKAAKLVLSTQTMALTQDSTLYASQFADGIQGLVSVMIKSDVALKVCSRSAGVTSTSNCLDVQANNKWASYKLPTVFGATSQGISIASSGNVSGTVYIDDAFVGASDLVSTYGESKLAGESYFAGTTACTWSRTANGTIGGLTADADCPGPTIVRQSLGQWQTTDSNLPRQTINNLPAGVYKAKFIYRSETDVANAAYATITDGTTSCEPQVVNFNVNGIGQVIECSFEYNSSGNRNFELHVGGVSEAVNVNAFNNITSPRVSMKFILEYYGSNSTYTTLNADTDWAACNFSTLAWQGLGTVTNNLECKRQGGDLLIKGRFTSGTVSGVEARMNLPTWNGVQLTSAGAQRIPIIQLAGSPLIFNAPNSSFFVPLIEPSVSYITFGLQAASVNAGLTKVAGSVLTGSAIVQSINARIPIEGWQNSNIIIGQFNGLEKCTDSYECTDVFSASISSAGVVSGENIDWINGNCATSDVAKYDCSYKSGIFTVAPNCNITILRPSSVGRTATLNSLSSSLLSYYIYNDANQEANEAKIVCQKQGVDYIGKTAKAVASDQNVRTPSAINVETFSLSYFTTSLSNACTSNPCGIDQVGSGVASVTRASTGSYSVNFYKTFSKIKCTFGGGQGLSGEIVAPFGQLSCNNCSTISFNTFRTTDGAVRDSFATLNCVGN